MKRYFVLLFAVALLFFFPEKQIKAQSLDESLNTLSMEAAKAYVQPLTNAFSSNLNSGWFSGSPSNSLLGFTFNVKVVGIGSFLNSESKNFSVTTPFRFSSAEVDYILQNSGYSKSDAEYDDLKEAMLKQEFNVKLSGPTVIGSKDETGKLEFSGAEINGKQIVATEMDIDAIKGVLDMSVFPTAAVQLNIGTVYGTQAALRWFPTLEIEDVGKLSLFGFGILHNINSWVPLPLPLNFSVGYFTQKMTFGDYFESKATQFGLYVSRQVGIGLSVTPYAGITYETATTTLTYDYAFDTPAGPSTQQIKLDLEGENNVGLLVGARLNIFFFNIAADYKIAKTNTFTASMFFGF